MSLHLTAPAVMVNVKGMDVVVEEVYGSGPELRSAVKESYKVLKQTMKPLCLVYDVPFEGLLDALEQSGGDIYEGMQAVICDSRHNTRHIAKLSNSVHYLLVLQDMSRFVEVLSVVMDVQAHGHLFCAILLLKTSVNC